jgi:hypothetical protein
METSVRRVGVPAEIRAARHENKSQKLEPHLLGIVLLEKLIVAQLIKNFPAFHGTRRFITVSTRARREIQSLTSDSISL